MSEFFLELSLLSLSLESLNVALKGTLIRFVGKYEHFKQNIAIFIISIDQLLDGLFEIKNKSINQKHLHEYNCSDSINSKHVVLYLCFMRKKY
jgi:hypothetical protein